MTQKIDPGAQPDSRRELLKTLGIGFAGAALAGNTSALARSQTPEPQSQGAMRERSGVYPVTAFGAAGDGKNLDTAAIHRAIEAAAAHGGTVVFPAGDYLSFTIRLKSNVALHLEQGAVLIAADTPASGDEGYDLAEPNAPWEPYQDYGHNHWRNSLIWGDSLHDISITGPGLIWGRGLSKGYGPGPKAEDPRVGNKSIALKNCRNVILRDFSILHGGHFGILATGVDNLSIDNLKIDTNRDGMDIDCCRNVRVSGCLVNSPWDDGICLKSSYALGSAKATENVTIGGCYVTGTYREGSLLDGTFRRFTEEDGRIPHTGRIKFGTESNGGFKNIAIANCVFEGCQGLALETVDGALLEDVVIANITMREIHGAPIFLRLGSRLRGPQGTKVGALRRVSIANVNCFGATDPCILSGIPGFDIEDVNIESIRIVQKGGGSESDAQIQVPENESKYPEPNMFQALPASGFFIRHVKGLGMGNINIETMQPDRRPAVILDTVRDVDVFRLKTPSSASAPVFSLRHVQNFAARFCDRVLDMRRMDAMQAILPPQAPE